MLIFEEVREGVRRVVHAFSDSSESHPWRRLGLGLALASAAVCSLVFALTRLAPMSQPPSNPDALAGTEPVPPSHEAPTDTQVPLTEISLLRTEEGEPPAFLAHPLPSKPYKGQKRPPCKPRVEVEINGGCWVPHELKSPCPEDLYEYQGKCYTVSMQPPPRPQSLGQ